MLELLKKLVVKISEAYDKLFKSWTRLVMVFIAYFALVKFLPDKLASIFTYLFLAFILIAIFGRRLRPKGPKN